MKRIKIMLTALTVIAVVGGALAFKASTKSNNICLFAYEQGTVCPRVAESGVEFANPTTTVDLATTKSGFACQLTEIATTECTQQIAYEVVEE